MDRRDFLGMISSVAAVSVLAPMDVMAEPDYWATRHLVRVYGDYWGQHDRPPEVIAVPQSVFDAYAKEITALYSTRPYTSAEFRCQHLMFCSSRVVSLEIFYAHP